MNYENLLEEAEQNNLYVIENADFKSKADGLIRGDVIGINRKVRSYKKRACILAEELGHFHTTTGNILDQSSAFNRKQEHIAKAWSYDRMVGLTGIVSCYRSGCLNLYEMAEHLDVTEDFLKEALLYYRAKYGTCTTLDNYVIYFEPTLGVFEFR